MSASKKADEGGIIQVDLSRAFYPVSGKFTPLTGYKCSFHGKCDIGVNGRICFE